MNEIKLNKRQIRETNYLLNSKTKITCRELGKVLSIKQRTLKDDLNIISSFLNSYEVALIRQPRVGVYIQNLSDLQKEQITQAIENFETVDEKLDKAERLRKILLDLLLLDEIPTIEDWANELHVSNFTVSKDIKEIKEWLKARGINLYGLGGRGYKIEAKEENIRKAILDSMNLGDEDYDQSFLINFFLNKSKGKLKKSISSLKNTQVMEDIEELINAVEEGAGIKIADEDYERFFNSILVSFFRTASQHFITPSETQLSKFRQIREFNIILDDVQKLYEKYNIDHYVEDSAFITINFIGLKINNFDAYPQNQLNDVDESYKTYTNLVINFLKELFSPSLNLDAEFQSMFALHLQRTFQKIELGIKIDNPLLQEIKHEYAFEFSIADRIAHFLEEKLNVDIPEEEKGFIAVYIKVALEKNRSRKKVIVLCPSGLITSNLIFFRLKNEMPELDVVLVSSLKDFEEMKDHYSVDLVVSTVPIKNCNLSTVVVSPLLTQEDKAVIKEGLQKNEEGKTDKTNKAKYLLDPAITFIQIDFQNLNKLLLYLGTKLYETGYVSDGYTKQLLENEKKFPTGIPTVVPFAIPHAEQKFSLKNGILIATLKNPVIFREMGNADKKLNVQIVLIPVFSTETEENIEFFDSLLRKISNPKIANKILQATTKEELYNIIA